MSLYKKPIPGIYALEWDDAIYIGSSVNITNRWHSHIINPSTNKDLTLKIKTELPSFKILKVFDKKPDRKLLLKEEEYYINKYINTNYILLNKRHKLLKDITNEKPNKAKKVVRNKNRNSRSQMGRKELS